MKKLIPAAGAAAAAHAAHAETNETETAAAEQPRDVVVVDADVENVIGNLHNAEYYTKIRRGVRAPEYGIIHRNPTEGVRKGLWKPGAVAQP